MSTSSSVIQLLSDGGSSLITEGLTPYKQFLRFKSGKKFTNIEHTSFSLLRHYIYDRPKFWRVLQQAADLGFTTLRVATAYYEQAWGVRLIPDEVPFFYGYIAPFLAACASKGIFIDFVAYTGWNDLEHWKNLTTECLGHNNVLCVSLVNEYSINYWKQDEFGRTFDITKFYPVPGLICSHGSNGSQEAPPTPFWDLAELHTNDAPEWWRKGGHNAMELWSGPSYTSERTRVDHDNNPNKYYDDNQCAALLCVGICHHTTEGKLSELLSGDSLVCAKEAIAGSKSINLECQEYEYEHHEEEEGPNDLRVYGRGPYRAVAHKY